MWQASYICPEDGCTYRLISHVGRLNPIDNPWAIPTCPRDQRRLTVISAIEISDSKVSAKRRRKAQSTFDCEQLSLYPE